MITPILFPFKVVELTSEQSSLWSYRNNHGYVKFDTLEDFLNFWYFAKTLECSMSLTSTIIGDTWTWNEFLEPPQYEVTGPIIEKESDAYTDPVTLTSDATKLSYRCREGLDFFNSVTLNGATYDVLLSFNAGGTAVITQGEYVEFFGWDTTTLDAAVIKDTDGSYWIHCRVEASTIYPTGNGDYPAEQWIENAIPPGDFLPTINIGELAYFIGGFGNGYCNDQLWAPDSGEYGENDITVLGQTLKMAHEHPIYVGGYGTYGGATVTRDTDHVWP